VTACLVADAPRMARSAADRPCHGQGRIAEDDRDPGQSNRRGRQPRGRSTTASAQGRVLRELITKSVGEMVQAGPGEVWATDRPTPIEGEPDGGLRAIWQTATEASRRATRDIRSCRPTRLAAIPAHRRKIGAGMAVREGYNQQATDYLAFVGRAGASRSVVAHADAGRDWWSRGGVDGICLNGLPDRNSEGRVRLGTCWTPSPVHLASLDPHQDRELRPLIIPLRGTPSPTPLASLSGSGHNGGRIRTLFAGRRRGDGIFARAPHRSWWTGPWSLR